MSKLMPASGGHGTYLKHLLRPLKDDSIAIQCTSPLRNPASSVSIQDYNYVKLAKHSKMCPRYLFFEDAKGTASTEADLPYTFLYLKSSQNLINDVFCTAFTHIL